MHVHIWIVHCQTSVLSGTLEFLAGQFADLFSEDRQLAIILKAYDCQPNLVGCSLLIGYYPKMLLAGFFYRGRGSLM